MSGAYYNDFDADVCAVLRELIKRGLIPDGEVDGRSILDVDPADLKGFVQCHFFAGVGGWGYALRLAGWPDDKPVWTGSPPCQPFSVAGKGLAADDPRHLGPAFVRLVRSARPGVLFGEQVASADVFGHVAGGRKRGVAGQPQWTWIDDLFLRLEAARYAAWAVDYPSASLGAPHIRQRTYFGAVRMAHTDSAGLETEWNGAVRHGAILETGFRGTTHRLADADDARSQGRGEPGRERAAELTVGSGGLVGGVADAECGRRQMALFDARGGRSTDREREASQPGMRSASGERPGPTYGPWGDADWLYCRDERWRPVETGTFPLAHGVPARVGRLRGYGNAINPHQAAHFIRTTYHG